MSEDVPLKKCKECKKLLPATPDYFYWDHPGNERKKLRNYCKSCARRTKKEGEARQEEAPTKWCRKCHHSYPATEEYFYRDHPGSLSYRLSTICKKCHNASRRRTREAHCDACGSTRCNLRGDIDMQTGHQYGYLCAKCAKLVAVSTDATRVTQVARYLKKRKLPDTPSPKTECPVTHMHR